MMASAVPESKTTDGQKRKKSGIQDQSRKKFKPHGKPGKSGKSGKPSKPFKSGPPPTARPDDPKYKSHEERAQPTAPSELATIDESIGKMDGRFLADYLAQRAKAKNPDMTAIELTDLHIPEIAFKDTSAWESARSLDNLPKYLEYYASEGKEHLFKSSEVPGSPHTIVVTMAGLRAADLTRALRKFSNKESTVAKLFAKHIKLKEAIETTEKIRMGMGVGTPIRLHDLIKADALKLDHLKRIVVDGSHVDQKKRGIFDMKDTLTPLLNFLGDEKMRSRYGAKEKVEILVY